MQTIKNIFIKGMDLVSSKSEYCNNIEEELSKIGIDVGEEMNEILIHFHEINRELKVKMFKKEAEELFKCIPMKMETFYEKFTADWMNKPILNYYDINKMVQRITCSSNEDIVKIKEMLIDRAKKNTRVLEPELSFINELKVAIDNYCEGKDMSIKIVMLKEFAKDLENITNLYINLPKKHIYKRKKVDIL